MTWVTHRSIQRIIRLRPLHIALIAMALGLSIALMSTQRVLHRSLTNHVNTSATTLLTGHLEFASNTPITTEDRQRLRALLPSHTMSERHLYSSMIQLPNDSTQLVEVLAVSQAYPLMGVCWVRNINGNRVPLQQVFQNNPNGIVVAKRLIDQYQLSIGDPLSIGQFTGPIIVVIDEEPDISVQSIQVGPRVYIELKSSLQTGFNREYSRQYQSLFFAFESPDMAAPLVKKVQKTFDIVPSAGRIRGAFGPSQAKVVRSYQDLAKSVLQGFDSIDTFFVMLSLFMMVLSMSGVGFVIWTSMIQQLPMIGNLRLLGVSVASINRTVLFRLISFIECYRFTQPPNHWMIMTG